ncbi:response regulator [Maridesulfovibrio salexigens]|uniref:histidine kinase n=1 Tax=Maridesulfovibrio salexigens (strain ATCC 14822 / DSM 2638 / NCIMB 8403 / VKM B-1763) TaxID=526222 RepID=C6BU36_MARSD|nr:response regulator [Maridesulfovibrio salexigens]ACS81745.1 CheA signal transduction histidine kinase [Maridesulfovibrio salexigens DSM 2638]
MTRDMADLSMLELFRMEAGNHTRVLEEGIPGLAADVSPEKVQPLIHAAHALKGSGKIVGLADAVQLSQAMETVLDICSGSGKPLSGQTTDALLAGTRFLHSLAEVEAEAMDGWLEERSGEFKELLASIESVDLESSVEPVVEADAQSSDQERQAEESHNNSEEISEPAPVQTAAPVKKDIPLADLSMLDLFRMEAESHSQALNAGLLELEKDQAPDKVEPLMRAAHSMKGAARIVGLTDAVALAHAMEDLLVSCQKGETVLDSDQIDLLLAATDIYRDVSQLETDAIQSFLSDRKPLMDQMEKALRGDAEAALNVCSEVCPQGIPTAVAEPVPEPVADVIEAFPEQGDYKQEVAAPAKEVPAATEVPAPSQGVRAPDDSVVRVSAGNLNRLMALAGESLVESGRLGEFASSLLRLKGGHRDLMKILEESCERVKHGETAEDVVDDLKAAVNDCQVMLVKHINKFDLYRRRNDNVSGRLYHEVIASRMRPFSDGGLGFPRLVRDLARSLGKEVDFIIEGETTSVDRDILDKLEAPLNHLIRNAVDHGIEMPDERVAAGKPSTGTIKVVAGHRAGMLFIEVRDDGQGLDPERIRAKVVERKLAPARMAEEMSRAELMEFLFLPGFSTAGKVTEISGRGVGLDVVHAMVQEVGGTVRADSEPGHGMSFSMQLPLTLSVIRTLLVKIADQPYAIPLSRISRIASVFPEQLKLAEDRQYVSLDGANVGLVPAAQILGVQSTQTENDGLKVVVISDRMNKYGLVVDDFLGEQDLVVRPLDHRLGKVPDVNSVAMMPDGSPVLILDAEDLVRSIDNLLSGGRLGKVGLESAKSGPVQKILVVDDSLTVREVERKLLVNHGYEVDTAVDGQDGLNAVISGDYDLVVTDVDMPRMNGLELTSRIKGDPDLKSIPVMMVSYKDRKEDKLRGLEAGADYYLTKSSFHDETLLSAVEDLIGGAGK